MLPARYRRLIGRRFRRRPLLGPLLAATVALNAVVWFSTPPEHDTPIRLLGMGFLAGQLGLLGAWTATSWNGLPTRLTFVACAAILLAAIHSSFSVDQYATMLTFAALAVTGSTVSCSVTGWVFSQAKKRKGSRFAIPASLQQFSIGALFAVTTALAVGLTILRSLNWDIAKDSSFLYAVSIEAIIPAVVLAAVTLASGWRRALALMTATVGLGLIAWLAMPPQPRTGHGPSDVVIMAYFAGLWATCVVWLLGLEVRPQRHPRIKCSLRLLADDPERPADESAERSQASRTLFIPLGFDATA
jgi:hypothetical protein